MADGNHNIKRCIVCAEEKPTTEFSKQAARKDGLRSQCKECDTVARKKYYAANADDMKAKAAKWRAENPEAHKQRLSEWRAKNPEKIKAQRKAWTEDNPDYSSVKGRLRYASDREGAAKQNAAYYAANKEYFAEANRRWRQENPDAARAITRRAKAARKGATGSFTVADIDRLKLAQKGKCCYCRKPLLKYHIDHIIPVSKGGSNYPSNLQLLCPPCNQSKKDKLPEDFARKMGFLI